jgi:hypothetical protein
VQDPAIAAVRFDARTHLSLLAESPGDLDAALRRHTAVAQAPPSGTLVRLDQGLTRFRGGVSRSG